MLNHLENFKNILKRLFKLRNMFNGNMFFDGLPSQMKSEDSSLHHDGSNLRGRNINNTLSRGLVDY
jgi:hypothetical protein